MATVAEQRPRKKQTPLPSYPVLVSFVWWFAIALDLLVWASWALLAGWWHRRTPLAALAGDSPRFRLRSFENAGSWYEQRLHIKAWKDHLPDTGRRFGISKRRLPGRTPADLERFAAECCRGERTHWTIMAGTAPLVLWSEFHSLAVMTAAGAAGNLPFVAVLRYNRARIDSILRRGFAPECSTSTIHSLAR